MAGEPIGSRPASSPRRLPEERDVVLLPDSIEKRNDPMMKQVEKHGGRCSPPPVGSDEGFRVNGRQCPQRSDQPKKRRGHYRRRFPLGTPGGGVRRFGGRSRFSRGGAVDPCDCAGRKRKRQMGEEADRLARWWSIVADRQPPRRRSEVFEQSNGLEEIKGRRIGEEPVAQTRVRSPLRGAHRFQTPSCCLRRATSWLNEFTVT